MEILNFSVAFKYTFNSIQFYLCITSRHFVLRQRPYKNSNKETCNKYLYREYFSCQIGSIRSVFILEANRSVVTCKRSSVWDCEETRIPGRVESGRESGVNIGFICCGDSLQTSEQQNPHQHSLKNPVIKSRVLERLFTSRCVLINTFLSMQD